MQRYGFVFRNILLREMEEHGILLKKRFKRLDLIRPMSSLKKTENNFGKAESHRADNLMKDELRIGQLCLGDQGYEP